MNKPRTIYLIERPEITPNGKNAPVLFGCYKTKKPALIVSKNHDKDNASYRGIMRYGKCRVIKFKEVVNG